MVTYSVRLTPIIVACPRCGSTRDVVYSCNPQCCFNHVCGRCYTRFELVTTKIAEFTGDLEAIPPDPDPSSPTAPCGRCGECRIFALEEGPTAAQQCLCVSCKALLAIDYSQIEPG